MDLAIVGAGAAGAGAAYALRDAPVSVTVFERSGSVGGRAATRRAHGCTYDYGANYVKADAPRVAELVSETLPTEGLVDVEAPVWTFDGSGDVSEGNDRDDHKWTYESGVADLIERLFEKSDAEVRFGARVDGLAYGDRWRLRDAEDRPLGTFDAALLTPPAPVTADLLAAAEGTDALPADPRPAVEAVPYRSIYSLLLGYRFETDAPWYGLVNADREHEIGWLSREELKRGHVPEGETLLVVQLSPEYSAERLEEDGDTVAADAAALVAELLDDERFADPDWTDGRAWRHALPDAGADADALRGAEREGLYFAGDWVAGDGRVHLAVESGLDAGDRIAASA